MITFGWKGYLLLSVMIENSNSPVRMVNRRKF